jgi:hypothetical protein
MEGDEINLRQSEKMALLLEVSDEALEAACGGLGGSPTPAHESYLLHLSPSIVFGMALDVAN